MRKHLRMRGEMSPWKPKLSRAFLDEPEDSEVTHRIRVQDLLPPPSARTLKHTVIRQTRPAAQTGSCEPHFLLLIR